MKVRQISIGVICTAIGLIAFSSCGNNPVDSNSFTFAYEQLSIQLNQAYEQDSQEQLDIFFENWIELIPPHTPQEISSFPDTVKEAYAVFEEFYTPANLSHITGGQHENFESEFRYVVVQNQLEIAVADTNPEFYYYRGVNLQEMYIDDFRPSIQNQDYYPPAYLSEQADSVIFYYLFNSDSTYIDDHNERVGFLRQAMQLTHHHWIPDYHKYTMPHASRVIFNDSFTKARIQFRVFYQFGDAYLERKQGEWKLMRSELTAIE